MTMSEVSDMGGGIELCFAALRVRLLDLIATVIDFCAPPIGDSSSVGYLATVSPGRHAVAQPEGHCRQGQRFDLAPPSRAVGTDWPVGTGSCRPGRHATMLRGDPTLILDTCSVW